MILTTGHIRLYIVKKKENENTLNEILQFQALKKIQNFTDYLEKKKKEANKFDNKESDTNESEESDSEEKESMSNNSNSFKKSEKDEIIKKFSSLKLQTNKNNNNNIITPIKESYSENTRNKPIEYKKDILNDLYTVDLSKIHFSIYDFNKDMVIDINFEKRSQIDYIIQKYKSKKIQNYDNYTHILYNSIIEDKKKVILKEI